MNIVRALLLFVLLMLGGCLSEEEKLRVAVLPWIGYESIYQAEEFGWLDNSIELVKGDIPSDSFKRIMNGEVDAAAVTMEDVILARTRGVELSIVAVLDISAGADIVLAKDSVKSLVDIKGKRIWCEDSALASLILTKMLEKAGLAQSDVTVVNVPSTQQLEAWNKDRVDIVITYEPYASKLFSKGAHYLISSREFSEMIFDVLAVRKDRLEGRESSIKKLLKAHFEALDYFHKNYKDILYRISAREGNSPDEIKRALGGVMLPSKAANRVFLAQGSNLYKSAKELNDLMFDKGFIAKKATWDDFTDPTFLKD